MLLNKTTSSKSKGETKMVPTTTPRGYRIGSVTKAILFNKQQSSLTDEEQRHLAVNVQKHYQERLDLVDAIEVCSSAKSTILTEYINGNKTNGGVVVRSHSAFEGQMLLNRVIHRLNNRVVAAYGAVVSA
jgi:hypothetical protein